MTSFFLIKECKLSGIRILSRHFGVLTHVVSILLQDLKTNVWMPIRLQETLMGTEWSGNRKSSTPEVGPQFEDSPVRMF